MHYNAKGPDGKAWFSCCGPREGQDEDDQLNSDEDQEGDSGDDKADKNMGYEDKNLELFLQECYSKEERDRQNRFYQDQKADMKDSGVI